MIKAREVARKKASKRKKAGRKYRKEEEEIGDEDVTAEEQEILTDEVVTRLSGITREVDSIHKSEDWLGKGNKSDPP